MAGCQNSVVRALCSATIAATSFAVAVEAWEPQRQQRSPRRWRVTQPKSFFYCGWNNKGEPSAVGASLAPPFPLFDPFSSTTTTTNLAAATSEVISPDRSLAIDDIIETDKSNKDLVMESLRHLTRGGSGSDIRGHFVNHSWGPEEADGDDGVWKQGAKSSRRSVQLQPLLNEVARAIQNDDDDDGNQDTATPPRTRRKTAVLTPLAAYCIGRALAISITNATTTGSLLMKQNRPLVVGIGVDPRPHGRRLADALADGIRSGNGNRNTQQPAVHVAMTVGIATTPACASFCRYDLCDAAVMVTASHLPSDRNGFKFFSPSAPSGFSAQKIQELGGIVEDFIQTWMGNECDTMTLGSSSSVDDINSETVTNIESVDWMPRYKQSLKEAILSKTSTISATSSSSISSSVAQLTHEEEQRMRQPLTGLKIVLNSGNGAGGFFQTVLDELGADVSGSIHLEPDGTFPNGIPNPENNAMLEQTIAACREAQADLGIMLDTDADRCGFVVPVSTPQSDKDATTTPMLHYEALNRNRLIALLGVVMAREKPGSAVVTDSVTSEGLSAFLQDTLGLQHVRYIKGYANVIGKARELTESGAMNAELAIETSGHCAMRENGYLDDGTYTAVQVVSLLARERASSSSNGLLDLISEMEELDEVCELRMNALDGSLETMRQMFNSCVAAVESRCTNTSNSAVADDVGWTVDADNLEGIRVRLGQGQFFMLRQSLHDPIISLQIEAHSQEEARRRIVQPLLHQFAACSPAIGSAMDISVLNHY